LGFTAAGFAAFATALAGFALAGADFLARAAGALAAGAFAGALPTDAFAVDPFAAFADGARFAADFAPSSLAARSAAPFDGVAAVDRVGVRAGRADFAVALAALAALGMSRRLPGGKGCATYHGRRATSADDFAN
jgi:hypothetical protein